MPKKEDRLKDAGEVIQKSTDEHIWEATDEPAEREVAEDFREEQKREYGRERLERKLEQHHSRTPELSGGDLDAAWDQADAGEETVGGDVATPDQDIVEELGAALGVTYQDTEPLKGSEKIHERDRDRWELDPASAEDYAKRNRDEEE